MKRRLSHSWLFLTACAAVLLGGVALLLFFLARLDQPEENYTLIEDGLYMGGDVKAPPPGVRAVLNLCEKGDPYRCETHVWEPVPDAEPAPDLDWLRRMVEFIDTQRRAGVPTFIHCRNGVSRSGMVVVAYEMYKNHWARDEALAFVRTRRPAVRPNPAFMRLLAEWEEALKGEPASRD
jgi:hypothetical protein